MLAMLYNANVEPKDRRKPSDFDPHQQAKKTVIRDPEHSWAVMRATFAPASIRN